MEANRWIEAGAAGLAELAIDMFSGCYVIVVSIM
jgi:hypothetical protein